MSGRDSLLASESYVQAGHVAIRSSERAEFMWNRRVMGSPVWLQCVVFASDDDSTVVGMFSAGVEICVVANVQGQMKVDLIEWNEGSLPELLVVTQI
jgi:hypothetical protein